jgi:hypothetical protein
MTSTDNPGMGASPDGDRAARLAWVGGKCRVPMWSMGVPAGFCDNKAFGEQMPRAILEQERGYSQRYNPIPYCHGPCCPGHGGPQANEPRLFVDGTGEDGRAMWCAVNPDFENLQESPAGFSQDPFKARAELRKASAGSVHEGAGPQDIAQQHPRGNEP